MTDPMDAFLAEGMRRYRPAAATMVSFGRAIEQRLKNLLDQREPGSWGGFMPTAEGRARSTTYWSQYPLLNAKIDGRLGDQDVRVKLQVNWYEADGDYPFYVVAVEGLTPERSLARHFERTSSIQVTESGDGLRFQPSEDDFNLERDFGVMLDALARCFRVCTGG